MAIVIAASILLIVYSIKSKRKKENKKLQLLSAIADKHNCKITKHEFFGDLLIGLDEKSNFLFLINNSNNKMEQAVNLSEIQKCRVVSTSRTVNSITVIDKLELCFSPADKNKPQVFLEFYNSDNSPTLVGELQLIEKWAEIVNNQLKKN